MAAVRSADAQIGTIAITDEGWYEFLEARPEVTELNFWTPSARRSFRAPQFSPFLFKLRAPHNAICGFAYFAQFSKLPDWLAERLLDACRAKVRSGSPRSPGEKRSQPGTA